MPVIVPHAEIRIKQNYLVKRFRKIKVTTSRKLPCDVCEITLPTLDSLNLFSENDEVEVILGNDRIGTCPVFSGYLSFKSPKDEPVFTAEDYFKEFKEKRNTKQYDDTPDNIASDIIQFCGFTPIIPETWGHKTQFYWKMQTAAEALEDLSRIGWDYFLMPTTRKVYFGKPYGLFSDSTVYAYKFGLNIIDSRLEHKDANPITKAIVYVTDSKFRGSSIKVEEGTGERSKIFNMQMDFNPNDGGSVNNAIKEATKFAKEKIDQSGIAGYKGSFRAFGNPFLTHSMKIKIEDPEKQERTGHYFVDQIVHEFSPDSGYKMEVSIGGSETVSR
jgi:hypothetical protein